MCRSAIVWTIVLALIATTCSKSIGFPNDEAPNSTIDSSVTTNVPLVHDEPEADSKLSAKRSLLILMPASEEDVEVDCEDSQLHSQKTKRCRSPIRGDRVTSPLGRDENIKNEGILRALQERLGSRDQIVGAPQRSSITKSDVFDDGNCVCYCRDKNGPLARKGTDQVVGTKSPSPTNHEVNGHKGNEEGNGLLGRKPVRPSPTGVPRRPLWPKRPLPHVPQHHASLRPKTKHPVVQQKGRQKMPYIPYAHHSDPEQNPTKFNIPLHGGAGKHDSVVGERAPVAQSGDIGADPHGFGQARHPSSLLGQSLPKTSHGIPTQGTNDQQEASNDYEYNLQSPHSNPTVDGEEPFDPEAPAQLEDGNVAAVAPDAVNRGNADETIGSAALDYSDIKEVTQAYFTSKAYSGEVEQVPADYDDFPITGVGQGRNAHQPGLSSSPEGHPTGEEAGNGDLDEGIREESDAVVGESSPDLTGNQSANDDLNGGAECDMKQKQASEGAMKEASPIKEATLLTAKGLAPTDVSGISTNDEEEPSTGEQTLGSPGQGVGNERTPVGGLPIGEADLMNTKNMNSPINTVMDDPSADEGLYSADPEHGLVNTGNGAFPAQTPMENPSVGEGAYFDDPERSLVNIGNGDGSAGTPMEDPSADKASYPIDSAKGLVNTGKYGFPADMPMLNPLGGEGAYSDDLGKGLVNTENNGFSGNTPIEDPSVGEAIYSGDPEKGLVNGGVPAEVPLEDPSVGDAIYSGDPEKGLANGGVPAEVPMEDPSVGEAMYSGDPKKGLANGGVPAEVPMEDPSVGEAIYSGYPKKGLANGGVPAEVPMEDPSVGEAIYSSDPKKGLANGGVPAEVPMEDPSVGEAIYSGDPKKGLANGGVPAEVPMEDPSVGEAIYSGDPKKGLANGGVPAEVPMEDPSVGEAIYSGDPKKGLANGGVPAVVLMEDPSVGEAIYSGDPEKGLANGGVPAEVPMEDPSVGEAIYSSDPKKGLANGGVPAEVPMEDPSVGEAIYSGDPEKGLANGGVPAEVPMEDPSVGRAVPFGDAAKDLENAEDDSFAAKQAAKIPGSIKDTRVVQSPLGARRIGGIDSSKDISQQSLPFCDNSLLQSTIKQVINEFATGDTSDETVGAAKNEDLLPEIVEIPNLRSIVTMPPIEKTIMDKVEERLSKVITVDRNTFDNDKMTNIIRNTLRHLFSAAPIPKTDAPPMAIEEHQFKDGKWVSSTVTLEPDTNGEAGIPTNDEKMKASVRNLIRNPAVGLQAAKSPAVQNMIVESVRNTFGQENDDTLDDSVIRNHLNEELSLMQTENDNEEAEEVAMPDEDGTASDSGSLDMSNIDMDKLLEIAKSEAGVDDAVQTEPSASVELNDNNPNEQHTDEESMKDGVVGMTKGDVRSNAAAVAPRNQEYPAERAEDDEEESSLMGAENTNSNVDANHDLAYLGKISLKGNSDPDNVQNLRNSELYYVGDGVKLPLEIRKLNDGTYALSISRKVCEHLLDKECPCCVPMMGNVVRTVRGSASTNHANKTIRSNRRKQISRDGSTKSILSHEREKRDLLDDSLHIFSMPVETFARKYNLSLNLNKTQAPWNFDTTKEIDERAETRPRSLMTKEKNNVDVDLLRNLLEVHAIPDQTGMDEKKISDSNNNNSHIKGDGTRHGHQMQEQKQGNPDRYRYQRNINNNANKRIEIVKSILNWLRDTILMSPK